MKKKYTYFLLTALCALYSCNEDDGFQCPAPIGELSAQVHEEFNFRARFVEFYISEERPDVVDIRALETSENCLWLGNLSFYLENKTGTGELVNGRAGEVNTTSFAEWDDDVILGRWDLYEAEPRTATVTRVDDEIIEGRFTATYVYVESPNNITTLPDTLRFRDVYFKAEFFDRNQ
ncbi:MAG: hypothetical protein ACFCUL_14375 [Flavobacteriaceae bacterium]